MKFLKTLFILIILSACQANITEEGFTEIGIEPYRMASDSIESSSLSPGAVSYTHLTLPTKRIV